MTKDLAICVHNTNNVPRNTYLNTHDFIKAVNKRLIAKLAKSGSKQIEGPDPETMISLDRTWRSGAAGNDCHGDPGTPARGRR